MLSQYHETWTAAQKSACSIRGANRRIGTN